MDSCVKKLVLGCGYLGRRVAALWLAAGHTVLVSTRSEAHAAELKRAGFEPVVCDVLEPASLQACPAVDTIMYSVGFDRKSGKSLREVYVKGLENVINNLLSPVRLIYISSTGVYGQTSGDEVNEFAATEPADESGKVVLEAERLLRNSLSQATVLRLAGIYGPGRLLRSEAVRAAEPIAADPDKLLNLVHVDDGAAAVLAADKRAQPGAVYNVCDDFPVPRRDFYDFLARLLEAPLPRFVQPAPGQQTPRQSRVNRRVSNRRMREELGLRLRYPTYREGLAAIFSTPPA